jgi:hypothetical protein
MGELRPFAGREFVGQARYSTAVIEELYRYQPHF